MLWYFWYPDQYFEIAGADRIVFVLLLVNLVLGPVTMLVVSFAKKTVEALKKDLLVLLLLQVCAVIYGVSVAADARPVALVFAKDRFSLVAANEVRLTELRRLKGYQINLPWLGGPHLLSIRTSLSHEVLDAISLAAGGFDLPTRPSYWQDYQSIRNEMFGKGLPLSSLLERNGLSVDQFEKQFLKESSRIEDIRFFPLESKSGEWVVLIDGEGSIVGFAPFSGFF